MTSILRKRVRSNFTMLPNGTVRDPGLSFRALGVLSFMLSLKDGTTVSAETLAETHLEGRDAVATALRELRDAGYYRTTRCQGRRGRWQTVVEVADVRGALLDDRSDPEAPNTGFQGPVPDTDSQGSVDALNPGKPSPGYPTSGDPCSRSSKRKTQNQPMASDEPTRHESGGELWRAVVAACGLDGSTPTPSERAAWAKAVADIASTAATPADVTARAAAFTRRWPDATLTPSALARRWSESIATTATIGPARHTPAPEADPIALARGRARTWASAGYSEADALGAAPTDPEERAAFLDAFHVEQAAMTERSSA